MTDPGPDAVLPASFRDPSGFVFRRGGDIYRAVCEPYRQHYDHLMGSGLGPGLIEEGLLIPHEEVETPAELGGGIYKTIRPRPIPFISYPYEWCFSQLQGRGAD